jgi:hypothetical protein
LAFGLLNWKPVEAFLHEVQLGAIQVDQALGIHDDLDAFLLEHLILGSQLIHELEHIGKEQPAS